jgi:hexokinase
MIFFPYMVGLFIGIQIGKGTNNSYYHHTEKITTLEKKLKEYERQL